MATPSENKIITLLTELRDLQLESLRYQEKSIELYQETQVKNAERLDDHLAKVKAAYEEYLAKNRRLMWLVLAIFLILFVAPYFLPLIFMSLA